MVLLTNPSDKRKGSSTPDVVEIRALPRIILVCDNAWLSAGMVATHEPCQDRKYDFLTFSALRAECLDVLDFSRDVIVYARSSSGMMTDIENLVVCYGGRKKAGDVLRFIVCGDTIIEMLMRYTFRVLFSLFRLDFSVAGFPIENLSHRALVSALRSVYAGPGYIRDWRVSDGLSLAQYRVLVAVMNGMSIPAIASRFGVSEKTVHTHRYNIIEKFGADNFFRFYRRLVGNQDIFLALTRWTLEMNGARTGHF